MPLSSECANDTSTFLYKCPTTIRTHFPPDVPRMAMAAAESDDSVLDASDTNPAGHEFLRDGLSFINKPQFKQELYASTDTGLQGR